MAISKEFLEAVSKDQHLKAELDEAGYEAIGEFLKAKGLGEEAAKILEETADKVAAAHGFEPADGTELDIDDLEGVSGGMKLNPIKSPKDMAPILRFIFRVKRENPDR